MRGEPAGSVANGSARRTSQRDGRRNTTAQLPAEEPTAAPGSEAPERPTLGEDTIAGDRSESGPPPATDQPVELVVSARAHRARPPTIDVRSLVFDPIWYLAQYADVAVAQLDPVQHYLDNGSLEGRDPNPFFSTTYYCEHNPDVVASNMNPFLHYILYGAREGRAPRG